MKTYYAAVEGFIEGAYRKVGESVGKMTDDQAKYLVMAGHVTDVAPAAKDEKKDK
ncbi:hypothetical protein J2045_003339 [Peteryoungia aggregata LMG 23059]|uniref:XkdX family protein n=1 Tax=Peteryoungia aggregata LMG 23059 TaxID=1368425 RepID=A0ABU0GAA8_9HYPH|nr:hypothetical protein [Peteryoungia aggregata]MDQ0422291.1 hypothetical protein [Peteryoungia aggregata LMG 23059]